MLFYSLTFIPMLLITLVAHELGHLLTARLLKIKVSGFQIGVGRTIFTFYTGTTIIRLTNSSKSPDLDPPLPLPGQLATIYSTTDKQGNRYAAAVLPLAHYKDQKQEQDVIHRRFTPQAVPLSGKVKFIDDTRIVLADVAWTLKIIPLMAAVYFPEDRSLQAPNLYNTTSWSNKTLITLAGPVANLILFILVILALAIIPMPQPTQPVLSVTSVTPSSAAADAGFLSGDRIIQINTTLLPGHGDISQAVAEAAAKHSTLTFHIHRDTRNLVLHATPHASTGKLGLSLSTQPPPTRPQDRGHPPTIPDRVLKLTNIYIDSFAALISPQTATDQNAPLVMGPVATAYYTAQAVEYAQLKAWLAILAAVTLATALVNIVPLPPLDGYRMVLNTIEALRHRPINPRIEQAIMYGGFSFLVFAGIYLLLYDILLILT